MGDTDRMEITIRAVQEHEYPQFAAAIFAAFSAQITGPTDPTIERWREVIELDRTLGAFDGDRVVATAAGLDFELTVPGGVTLAATGVTAVGVLPTHRRRGILTRLMDRQLDDVAARGDAVAVLGASEATIYGRFGYGPATWMQAWTLSTVGTVGLRAGPAEGLELVDIDTALEVVVALYDRRRGQRIGAVSRSPALWRTALEDPWPQEDAAARPFAVVHRTSTGEADGVAIYRARATEKADDETRTLTLFDLVGTDEDVEAILWRFLLEIDLVHEVRASARPVDEPLRWRLEDPGRLVTTSTSDDLWLRVLDPGAALAARRYATDDRLVMEITDPFRPANDGRWLVEGGPDGAAAHRTSDPPDLALGIDALGSLYLGGVAPSVLARAGRVVERQPGALARADVFLVTNPAPWCGTDF